MPAPAASGPRSAGFQGLLWTQALGSFNDNAFKTLITLYAVSAFPPAESSRLIALAGALFVLPFIVFSTAAGALADRCGKKKLIVLFKVAEFALMALAVPALKGPNIPFLLALLALMGVHSAFFSPVKLAILPEILPDEELSNANGLMQMMSFLGILLGSVAGGLLIGRFAGRLHLVAGTFLAAAAAGTALSLLIPDVPAAAPGQPIRLNFFADSLDEIRALRAHATIYLATVAGAFFWFLAAIFQMNILVYGKEIMHAGPAELSAFQVAVAVGIGVGSWVSGRLSRERVELGLVPLGALGLVVFSLDLAFAYHSVLRAGADLFLLGFSGGCFSLPLQVFVQHRSPPPVRGRFIATGNLLTFVGVLVASACLWAFNSQFGLNSGQVFLVAALMTSAVAVYIVRTLPDFLLRLLVLPLSSGFYRIRAEGTIHVPKDGAALLVSNHVSFIDAFLIGAATDRMVRFLMYRTYYDLPVLNWFFRAMGCIPISDRDGPRELIRSFEASRKALEAGEVVCIFAEGEITRLGQMQRFKKGFERIVSGLEVPVIPVHLDRVWGSIFSFSGGRVIWKKPRRIPYPVTVSFGAPLSSSASAGDVREAISELGCAAFSHRLAEKEPLPLMFAREAKRHWFRFALADSSGKGVGYGMALVRAYLLGRELARGSSKGEAVGLLLPPSVPAALANLGLALHGRVPINLNYTASSELVARCAGKAGAKTVATSRAFLAKLGWEPASGMVFLEDAAKGLGGISGLLYAAAFFLLPCWALERTFLRRARGPLEGLATVIFTSGSTGDPKGVMLTQANVHANIEALAQVFSVVPEDRILGVLPFFHSFGYTVTLWFPLVTGFGAVYHYSPLDSKRIGELARTWKATFLLGTPTFLAAYLRRVEPEAFKTLSYVMVGAEKLREEVAKAFEERFGLRPLEGYGCTELSPVAAVNVPDAPPGGPRQRGTKAGTVGQPLPGVLLRIVDPESGAPVPEGQPGLLLVKGPNVMKGYLGEPEKTAEAMADAYYRTGDIAVLDPDGFVSITDRLSRFSKIGGEMVPHIRVEETLHRLAGKVDQTFVVTGAPDGKRGEKLVVFAKGYDDVDGLWKKLNETDLPKLWIPAREDFRPLPEFPLLGTGKLDLQKLKALAKGEPAPGAQGSGV